MSALTIRLALFAVLSSGLVTATLAGLGEPSVLSELRHFATATQGVDSWRPMNQARAYLDGEPDAPLYAWIFFQQKVKFLYPPTSLLLLDLLPREGLQRALNLLSWLMVLCTAALSAAVLDRALQTSRHAAASPRDRALRVAVGLVLALSFYPVLKAYSLGQMQVVVNALFAGAVLCWLAERKALAGVLVVLMAAVKPQYGLIALWGVLRGERRFVVAAAGGGALLLLVSLLRFGIEHHADYLSVLSHVSRHGEAYWPNQTVGGFLHRLLGNGVSSHWDPRVYPPYHPVVHFGSLAAAAGVLAWGFWPLRGEGRGGVLDFATAALATTLASPIAWEHHYGVLLPILAAMLPAVLDAARRTPVALPAFAAAYLVCAHYLDVLRRIDGTAWNPLQSLLLFTALGLLAALAALRGASGAPSVRHS